MRSVWAIGLLALVSARPLAAQISGLPSAGPAGGLSGLQIQPFKLDSSGLKGLLVDCKTTTLAGAEQEIKTKTQRALLLGTVAAVVEFLSAGEGPEGRAVSEFIPILVAKVRVPAALGLLGAAETKVYEGRGYRQNDRFEVCSPGLGLSDLTVLRPAPAASRPFHPIGGDQLQPLPTLSLGTLSKPRLGLLESEWLKPTKLPICESPTGDAKSTFAYLFSSVSGTVLDTFDLRPRGLPTSPFPLAAQGAQVNLIGPTPGSCLTSSSGGFSFPNLLDGSYLLMVTQLLYQPNVITLSLKAGNPVDMGVLLRPNE